MRLITRILQKFLILLFLSIGIVFWVSPFLISYMTKQIQNMAYQEHGLKIDTSGVEWLGWNKVYIDSLIINDRENRSQVSLGKAEATFSWSHLLLRSVKVKSLKISHLKFFRDEIEGVSTDAELNVLGGQSLIDNILGIGSKDLDGLNEKFQRLLSHLIDTYPGSKWSISLRNILVDQCEIEDKISSISANFGIQASAYLSKWGSSSEISVLLIKDNKSLSVLAHTEKLSRQILVKGKSSGDLGILFDTDFNYELSLSSRINPKYLFDVELRKKVSTFFPQEAKSRKQAPFEAQINLKLPLLWMASKDYTSLSLAISYDPQELMRINLKAEDSVNELADIKIDYSFKNEPSLTGNYIGYIPQYVNQSLYTDHVRVNGFFNLSKDGPISQTSLSADHLKYNHLSLNNIVCNIKLLEKQSNNFSVNLSFNDNEGVIFHGDTLLTLVSDIDSYLPTLKFEKITFASDELIASGEVEWGLLNNNLTCDIRAMATYDLCQLLGIPYIPSKENFFDLQLKGIGNSDLLGSLYVSYEGISHPKIVADSLIMTSSIQKNQGVLDIQNVLEIEKVRLGAMYDPKVKLTSRVFGSDLLQIEVDLESSELNGPKLTSELSYSITDINELSFETFDAYCFGVPIRQEQPFKVEWSSDSFLMEPLIASIGEGSIFAEGYADANDLTIDLEIDKFPLLLGNVFLSSSQLSGTASLLCKGSINKDEDLLLFEYQFDDIYFLHDVNRLSLSLLGKAILVEGYLHNEASLSLSEGSYELWSRIPLLANLNPYKDGSLGISLDYTQEHSSTLKGKGAPLAYLNLIQPHQIFNDGVIEADIRVAGFGSNYTIHGFAKGSGLTYSLQPIELDLYDIEFDGLFKDNKYQINKVKGRNQRKGTIEGQGFINLNLEDFLTYDINFNLNHIQATPVNQILVESKGELTLTGSLSMLNIAGKMQLQAAEVGIPDLISFKMPLPLYDYQGKSLSPGGKPPELPKKFFPINVDLEVDARDKVSFEGRGLQSTWGGKLSMKGEVESLSVIGTMTMKQGLFSLAGRMFDIQTATIEFVGPLRKALIQVVASLTLPDIIAIAEYSGPILNPTITLKSQPFKTQKEILSLILFGKSLAEVSPLESIQLASVLLQLGGSSNNPTNVLGAIGKSVGIDRLEFEGGGDNPVSVSAGKYVSKGVFVNLTKPIYSDANIFSLGVEFRRNVKLQADFSDADEDKIMIKWQKRYR